MASHHQHRPHIEPRTIAIVTRDHETRRAIEARLTTPRHVTIKPTLLERFSDVLNDRFGFGIFIGFVAGCFFTVGAAALWSLFL